MSSGIRATVSFPSGEICPIAPLSARPDTTVRTVVPNVSTATCTTCVTEFTLETNDPPEVEMVEVFSHGSVHRYRLDHGDGLGCPCETLGEFGCTVSRYDAHDGDLTLSFHATDYDELRAVIAALRDRFPEVDIRRLIRSPTGDGHRDSILVDRERLTDRQLEVLRTAYEMGYFERPRRANAGEVADRLDIDPSTFSEHLAAAQGKLFEEVLEGQA